RAVEPLDGREDVGLDQIALGIVVAANLRLGLVVRYERHGRRDDDNRHQFLPFALFGGGGAALFGATGSALGFGGSLETRCGTFFSRSFPSESDTVNS